MLLDKLAKHLEDSEPGFSYIRDDPRMEIWVNGKEWLPILVSRISQYRHIVSWGEVEYEIIDEEKAYCYVLRIFWIIKESKNDNLGQQSIVE